jgi:hypothetical protein
MSVLHPVGPEPPQTYWVRRAVVLGTALVALIVLIALIASQNSDGSVVAQGSPSPLAPSPLQSPQASPTPVASDSVSSAVTNAPSPSASTSASQSASASADPSGRAAAKPSPSTSTSTSNKSTAKANSKANSKAKPTGPVACAPSALRPTLTGDRLLKPKESNTFKLSLINGSGQTCKLAVSGENFELKIYSGKDRIWSSHDCSTSVKAINQKLSKEEAAAWSMTWDGRRSRKDCTSRPEIPKPGTYIATAQFADAKPVRMRMILHH